MTNKEAVSIVERIRYYMKGGECWADTEFEAMDMAIEALGSCDGCKWENAFGYGECHHCKRRYDDMYEAKEEGWIE